MFLKSFKPGNDPEAHRQIKCILVTCARQSPVGLIHKAFIQGDWPWLNMKVAGNLLRRRFVEYHNQIYLGVSRIQMTGKSWNSGIKSLLVTPWGRCIRRTNRDALKYDGVEDGSIDSGEIPPGFLTVPVKVVDNDDEFETKMAANSVVIICPSNGEENETGVVGLNTIKPVSGW
ncbi:hypothetical protein Q7P37_000853 [Cladosporium fusiforme]